MKIGCPKCGSNVTFKPETQNFYCEHCGQHSDIGEFSVDLENINDNYDECTCSSCGAKLIVGKNTTITVCIYCGSNQIITNRFTGEFLPDEIIPFKVSKEEFIEKYRKFIKKKPYVPDEFKKADIFDIFGVYVPYLVFKYDIDTYARGAAYLGEENKYFETKYLIKYVQLKDMFKNLPDDVMSSIAPFNFLESEIFNPAYLNGFCAENGDENKKELKDQFLKEWKPEFIKINDRLRDYHFFGGKCNIKATLKSCKLILLPVWFFKIDYGIASYPYAMNGQTAKIAGRRLPIDWSNLFDKEILPGIVGLFIAGGGIYNAFGFWAFICFLLVAIGLVVYYFVDLFRDHITKEDITVPFILSQNEELYKEYTQKEYYSIYPKGDCQKLDKEVEIKED
ncbi:MAG: hypothetical protein IJS47_03550 [Clostridia bacterium]|nr:hypothetical protein [Clostridia bacterium]